jgi:protein TonB
MKRKLEEVPEFDEIIFENRNQKYGAYKLRKQYKSTTSLSILGGAVFATLVITALSFTTEKGTASSGPIIGVIEFTDPLLPDPVTPPEIKPPAAIAEAIKNLQPEVVNDTVETPSYIPTTDELIATVTNGEVNDPVIYVEPVDVVIPDETKPRIIVQEMPEFPGGNAALLQYVSENLKYPQDAQDNNIQGKVTLKFVVNADGSVDRIEIMKSVDPLLDNEAIRVVKLLPKFKPGKQDGVPVPVWFTIPVTFQIKSN